MKNIILQKYLPNTEEVNNKKEMEAVPHFNFYKTKYGDELLIDVVELKDIKKYLLPDTHVHSLTYYDITLITDGEGFFKIEDREYSTKAGDIIFSLPNQYRQWDLDKIVNGYALIFEEEFLLNFFNDSKFLDNISYFNILKSAQSKLTLSADEYRQIIHLIHEIKHEIQVYAEKDKHILRAILYQVLKYLDRIYLSKHTCGKDPESNNLHVKEFIKLVNSNFQQHHSVQYYANEICLTPNHLNELVCEYTGFSAKQIIQDKLMSEAKKMLQYTNYTVKNIAEYLNFEDTSYFIRAFRKYTGFTPLRFRNSKKP